MASSLAFDILARDRASKTFDKVSRSADQTNRRFGMLSTRTKHMSAGMRVGFAGVVSAMSGLAAATGIKSVIEQASDLGEVTSKVGVVFGKGATQVEKFAASSAKSLGQSKLAAMTAASTFGVFGKMAGKTGTDLASFSTKMVGLSSDLASFHNTKPEEAIEALGAALRGESEPIRRYGVLLDDATLRNRALKMGLISTTKDALSPANKVLAAQAEIMAQTKDAQGDFQRTSGGLANQQRILAAQFDNVKAKLGEHLLPIATKVAKFFVTKGIPAFEAFIAGIQGKGSSSTDGFATAMNKVGTVVRNVFDFVKAEVVPRLQSLAGWIGRNKDFVLTFGAVLLGGATAIKIVSTAMAILNAVMRANPIGIVITVIALLVAGLITAYRRSETFRKIVDGAFRGIAAAGKWMWENALRPAFEAFKAGFKAIGDAAKFLWSKVLVPTFKFITNAWMTVVGAIVNGAAKAFGFVKWIGPKLEKAAAEFNNFRNRVNNALNGIKDRTVRVNAFAGLPKGVSLGALLHRESGGILPGPPSNKDNMLIHAASGEYVVNARATQKHRELLEAINADRVPGFANGGLVVKAKTDGAARKLGLFAGAFDDGLGRLAGRIKEALTSAVSGLLGGMGGGGVPSSVSGNAAIVKSIFASMFGWAAHWPATYRLLMKESGFRNTAQNPTSTAYGMFQFLNSTWAGTGIGKTSDPRLQTIAGGRYIGGRYGNPTNALNFHLAHNWYKQGTPWVPEDQLAMVHRGEAIVPAEVNKARLQGGMPMHVTIDENALARALQRVLKESGQRIVVLDQGRRAALLGRTG